MAVTAKPTPAGLPLPGGSPGATVTVRPLRCGEVLLPPRALDRPRGPLAQPRAMLLARRSRWSWVPVPVFLVEHPTAGRLLVDTGFHASVQDGARTSLGRRQAWIIPARQRAGESAPEQLRAHGVEPGDIATVVMTHLHNDHASGAIQFPDATFVVDDAEWRAACKGGFAEGYRHEHFDQPFDWRALDYAAGKPYAGFERSLDLFGDGSVRLLSTRGHTKGHQSVLLRLRDRELLLTADAAYTRYAIEHDVLPIFVFGGADRYQRSLDAIRAYAAATPDAVVICGHDAERWPELESIYRLTRPPATSGREASCVPEMLRAALTALLATSAAALAAAPAASARSIVIATGTNDVVLTDLPSNRVVARIDVGARTRAVAAVPDGSRAFVAAGNSIVVVDLATRVHATAPPLAGAISSLALSQDGTRLLAARRGAIDVIDTATITPVGRIDLKGAKPGAIATRGGRAQGRGRARRARRARRHDDAAPHAPHEEGRARGQDRPAQARQAPRARGDPRRRRLHADAAVGQHERRDAQRAGPRHAAQARADQPQARRRRGARGLAERQPRGDRREPRRARRRDRRPHPRPAARPRPHR